MEQYNIDNLELILKNNAQHICLSEFRQAFDILSHERNIPQPSRNQYSLREAAEPPVTLEIMEEKMRIYRVPAFHFLPWIGASGRLYWLWFGFEF